MIHSISLVSIIRIKLLHIPRRFIVTLCSFLPFETWAASDGVMISKELAQMSVFFGVLMTLAVVMVWVTMKSRIGALRKEVADREADLLRSNADWNQAMDFLEDPMYLVDLDDRLVRANKAFYKQIGKGPEDALGVDVRTLIHLKPEKVPCPACAARLEKRDAFFTKEAHDPTNPTGRPIEVTIRVVRDDQGRPIGMLQGLRDLSHLRATEEALYREKERAQVTLNSIGDAVLTTDSTGAMNYLNPAAEAMLGQGIEDVDGHFYGEVLRILDEATQKPAPDPIAKCFGRKAVVSLSQQTILINAEGQEFAVDVTAAPMQGKNSELLGAVLVLHNMTAMRGLTRQLNYQATHDALTGLINRREFEVRLGQVMESAKVDNTEHSLLFIDLDRFKVINDTCGHLAGDEVLKQLANNMSEKLRSVDTFARLGGDEFALILECCPLDTAERIGKELLEIIQAYRLEWGGKTFDVGASMGLAAVTAESGDITEVLSQADSACYAAKDAGRNRIYRYLSDDPEVTQRLGEGSWVPRITQALAEDRFVLYCQAVRKLAASGHEAGHFEVLVRMLDESGSIVPPGDFIPPAERYQMMQAIDRWVVSHTLDTLSRDYVNDQASWFINLSGQSLGDPGFLVFIKEEIRRTKFNPHNLCFEITETAAVANLSKAREFIDELRKEGVRFALDDFGSGLSSFAYLKNLHIDYLKIDGGFVRDMVDDPVNYAMVRSIHEIGQTMGINTIAEFVETEAILAKLHELEVNFAQGYGIEKPRPLYEVLDERLQTRAS
jgi:diguanylate cyclase (GGDEF)-like protein/PAS domain S-box-containing protein